MELAYIHGFHRIEDSFNHWASIANDRFYKLKGYEEAINQFFIDTFGLENELTPEINEKDITASKADLQREIKSLISYAVGCMFGRYSLDASGLIYTGNIWEKTNYIRFQPDLDGIIPICDDEYFADDIVGRFSEFLSVVFGKEKLNENLKFVANAIGGKGTPRQVIRSYFINDFYADHCSMCSASSTGKKFWGQVLFKNLTLL